MNRRALRTGEATARRAARPSGGAISLTPHFRPLRGLPAWNVKRGYGTFLTLEFGEPHLEVREPTLAARSRSPLVRQHLGRRAVHVHGEWHLWIYCCHWRVLRKGVRVGSSESAPSIMDRAASELQGQKLLRVTLPRAGCTRFTFDLGGVLETRPWSGGQHDRHWLLFDPRRKVLVLRGDGMFSYHGVKTLRGNERWQRAR